MVTVFALLSLISGGLCLLMAAVVFYNNPGKSLNRSFSLFCLFTGFWACGEFMHRQADSITTAQSRVLIQARVSAMKLPYPGVSTMWME